MRKMKYYCHVCDRIDWYQHSREHFNWEEFATPEKIARAEERRMGYYIMLMERVKRRNDRNT